MLLGAIVLDSKSACKNVFYIFSVGSNYFLYIFILSKKAISHSQNENLVLPTRVGYITYSCQFIYISFGDINYSNKRSDDIYCRYGVINKSKTE